jgi:Ca-activated chloride channel homolog
MNRILLILLALCLQAASALSQTDPQKPQPSASGTPGVSLSYGIVVDNSGSYRLILNKVVDVVKNIVDENAGEDETFIVRFIHSKRIHVVQDLTRVKSDLNDAAENLYIEGGQTAILDAVYFSAKHLVKNLGTEGARDRVLILISDGDERESTVRYEELAKFLKEEKIRVFVIGMAEERVFTKILERIAKDTGGKVYLPKNAADMSSMVKTLSTDIRSK